MKCWKSCLLINKRSTVYTITYYGIHIIICKRTSSVNTYYYSCYSVRYIPTRKKTSASCNRKKKTPSSSTDMYGILMNNDYVIIIIIIAIRGRVRARARVRACVYWVVYQWGGLRCRQLGANRHEIVVLSPPTRSTPVPFPHLPPLSPL